MQRLRATDRKANSGWMTDAGVWAEILWSPRSWNFFCGHLFAAGSASFPPSLFPFLSSRLCFPQAVFGSCAQERKFIILTDSSLYSIPASPAPAQTACKLASYTVLSLSITLVPAGKIIYNFITLQGIISFNCHNNQLVE